jgi:energy-coupling factor transport system permease protein
MKNKDTFSAYHPIVNFAYFLFVLLFSMIFMHPYCLFISLACSVAYSINLSGRRALKFSLKYMLPLMIITAVINPVFNHEGITILTYLRSGNPLTLESIVYGAAASVMLVTVVTWFSCYNSVMTSDKFVYLFGRIIPALSLVFSMTLRFVPRFRAQLKVVSNAQKCVGRDISNGRLLDKARHGITILSVMVSWALENAVETADSMKSRGYGLRGRTAFSIYRFDRRDRYMLLFLLFCAAYIITGAGLHSLYWQYYPRLKGNIFEPYTLSLCLVYLALCVSPLIINLREDRKWKYIESKT